jgi:hypothetical protein
MELWQTRNQSRKWLDTELATENQHLEKGYALLDECISRFNKVSNIEKASLSGQVARVCALTTTKGRNLLLGCHSLALDGLAQESGALLRPLLESIELLTYFRLDPNRVNEAFDEKLPSPGSIGKSINGQFQFLRDYLNEHASHFKFGFYSVFHLLDKRTMMVKPVETHSLDVLKRNLAALSAFMSFLAMEATGCLFVAGVDANELADRIEHWKETSKVLFPAPVTAKS